MKLLVLLTIFFTSDIFALPIDGNYSQQAEDAHDLEQINTTEKIIREAVKDESISKEQRTAVGAALFLLQGSAKRKAMAILETEMLNLMHGNTSYIGLNSDVDKLDYWGGSDNSTKIKEIQSELAKLRGVPLETLYPPISFDKTLSLKFTPTTGKTIGIEWPPLACENDLKKYNDQPSEAATPDYNFVEYEILFADKEGAQNTKYVVQFDMNDNDKDGLSDGTCVIKNMAIPGENMIIDGCHYYFNTVTGKNNVINLPIPENGIKVASAVFVGGYTSSALSNSELAAEKTRITNEVATYDSWMPAEERATLIETRYRDFIILNQTQKWRTSGPSNYVPVPQ